jgi:hypothetical protein
MYKVFQEVFQEVLDTGKTCGISSGGRPIARVRHAGTHRVEVDLKDQDYASILRELEATRKRNTDTYSLTLYSM